MPSHTAPMPWKSIGELMDAGAFTALSGFPCGEHNSDGHGVLQVRPFNVTNQATIFLGQQKHVPVQAALGKPSLIKGDIVFNNTNTKELVGKTALWMGPEGCVFSNHMTRIRVTDPTISPRYLATAIHAHWLTGRSQMLARAHVAQASILGERFREIRVPWPPYDQQSALAQVFDAIDASLASEDEADACVFDLKRAAMQSLFSRGLRGEAQKDTEIGPVPKSWDVVPIGSVATNTQYGMSVRGQPSGKYPILRMNCQEDGKVHYRNLQFVDLDEETFETFRLQPGDLLFNRTNSIDLVGRMAMVEEDRHAVFASYLVRVSLDDAQCLPAYLNYFMNWPKTQDEIKKLASRAVGQANINASKMRTVLFPLPTLDEQREIVAILDAIDRKIDLHRRKRAVLDELFKALLHKLMTGEIRVTDLDLAALAPAKTEAAA